ncbi:MAG TPA: lipoprotein-releasing ABC transporter permease subunit [Pseudomonadales bacterium]|nr:lipoprotein-releasing ABC transporter permease subunit [Pseudomonadales bacterium]
MFYPLAVNIGLRYANSRRSFISFISIVAIAGLVLSVAVLVLVTSVMNGFERELKERVLGVVPHLTVRGVAPLSDWTADAADLAKVPGVVGVAPFIDGTGLLVANGRSSGVTFSGIDVAREGAVSDLAKYVSRGRIESLVDGSFGVMLGRGVADHLSVAVGDSVTAVLPDASVSLVGLIPRQKKIKVVAIVDTQSELDQRSAYLALGDAARLFRRGSGVDGLNLRLSNLFDAAPVGGAAVAALGPDRVYAITWMRMHGNLYRAIEFQRAMMFLLLSLLVGVAAFNLVSALIMVVNQRRGDVAVLRTLGAGTRTIVVSFLVLGGVIGLAGVGLGLLLGTGTALLVQDGYRCLEHVLGLHLMSQYFISYLPAQVKLADLVTVAAVALLLSLGSTLYPAYRAARLKPADVLKHE